MASPVTVSRIQNRRGTQSQFDALYPPGYTGTGGVDILLWPNILLPGELALCTDSRKMFMGNLNGEYIEVGAGGGGGGDTDNIVLTPITFALTPQSSYTVVPALTISIATPYFTILYDITDLVGAPGNLFSRNGQLQITAVKSSTSMPPTVPPFPPTTPATLSDVGTEINLTAGSISFIAQYSSGSINILYKHNFSGSLSMSTSTLHWSTF